MSTCSTCRHHSKQTRARVIIDEDAADFEMIAEDETETDTVYFCQHPNAPASARGREVGLNEAAGVGCELFQLPARRELSEDLLRRMREFDERNGLI